MERDGFCCTSCFAKDVTLHVHHLVPYEKNRKVWDYEDCDLRTLCEDCHKTISENNEMCKLITMGISRNVSDSDELVALLDDLLWMQPKDFHYVRKFILSKKHK